MMVHLALLTLVFSVLCEVAASTNSSNSTSVPGVSSASGYLVFDYYEFSQCMGAVHEKRAVALGACVPPGLRGEPYGSDHSIFTNNSDGEVTVELYVDAACTRFRQVYETFYFDSCSTSGDSVFYTYSAQLPDLSLYYASVDQVIYNSSNDAAEDCDRSDDVVLSYALYSNACRQNCMLNKVWEYCVMDYCVNSTVNVSYYSKEANDLCPANASIGYKTTGNTCNERISCFDPNDFLPPPTPSSDSSSDNDDSTLSTGGIVGVVIACIVVAAIAIALVVDRLKPRENDAQIDLKESLTDTVSDKA